MNPADDSTPKVDPMPDPQAAEQAERRAALAKLGALAAWTAPVILTLTLSRRVSAESKPDPPVWP